MGTARRHSVTTGLSEQEVRARVTAAWVGIWMSVIVCIGAELYALFTWTSGENRETILLVTTIGLVSSPLIGSLPLERIIRSPYREVFFVVWTSGDIALIAYCAHLDGGPQSPFVLMMVLPFLYSALSYPLWATAVCGVAAIGSFVTVAVAAGDDVRYSAFGAFAILCVALMGAWEARLQAGRRRELTDSATALARSETVSRLGAEQQREVARFGQMALEGMTIDKLQNEAMDMLVRTLDADLAALVRWDADAETLTVVAEHGMPGGDRLVLYRQRRGRLPGRLHPGHREPRRRRDWDEETRFQPVADP